MPLMPCDDKNPRRHVAATALSTPAMLPLLTTPNKRASAQEKKTKHMQFDTACIC